MNQFFQPSDIHFAGHDTFHLRYTWLPKAAEFLKGDNDSSLSDYEVVMTELGLGKNMAKSLGIGQNQVNYLTKIMISHISFLISVIDYLF